jgi:hypothetical protein
MLTDRVLQVFEAAGLFDDHPSVDVVQWWDRLAADGWSAIDSARLERGRAAERRSFEHEESRLAAAGCPKSPVWMSLDDNQVGYDIASWVQRGAEWVPLLIEVKSTAAQVPAFYLSRPEYETCVAAKTPYCVHLWTAAGGPLVVAREAIVSGAPQDGRVGAWSVAYYSLDAGVAEAPERDR